MTYTQGSLDTLDLVTDAVLTETFEFRDGLLKWTEGEGDDAIVHQAVWTLRPAGHPPYLRAMRKFREESPVGRLRGLRGLTGEGVTGQSLLDHALGDSSAMVEIASSNGSSSEAAKALAEYRLEKRLALEKKIDATLDTSEKASGVPVEEEIADLKRRTAELLAEHLVVRVDHIPVAPPPNTTSVEGLDAMLLFNHPEMGDDLLEKVQAACQAKEKEVSELLEAQVKNSPAVSASSGDSWVNPSTT